MIVDLHVNVTKMTFEREGPFPEERKGEIFGIVNDIMNFAIQTYDAFIIRHFEAVFHKRMGSLSEEEELEFKHHLFWWIVFCQPLEDENITIFQEFLQQNWRRWKYDQTILQVICSWAFIHPGFYIVIDRLDEHVYLLKDLTNGEIKNATVYNETFAPPKTGDLLSGLLLSFCDGTYSPIFDFLRIKKSSVTSFTQHLFSRFKQSPFTSFSHFFQNTYGDLMVLMKPYIDLSKEK